ncbi:MAG TPA: hypothetical protein VMP89_04060 [Solirubrobacteraceae bacterium]|nr:hypothetical protein [Solirubrobacteraceae bacterium]
MPYERSVDIGVAEDVVIRYSSSGRPIERYSVVLLVRTPRGWREVRVFDNHQGSHHMHRYTPTEGKQSAEVFHPGPARAAIPAAIRHLKDHWEAIVEPWKT